MPFNGEDPRPEFPVPTSSSAGQWETPPDLSTHESPTNEIELAWLHPTSMFFDILSHGRQNLVPAAIALFSAANGNLGWLLFALFIFGLSFLHTAFRYFTLRYQIKNGELTVMEGLIFKRVRTVPLERIQNIDSTQKVLHRLFNVAEVRVETASGKEPEAILRVLSLEKIAQLRDTVFRLKADTAANTGEVTRGLLPGEAAVDARLAPLSRRSERDIDSSNQPDRTAARGIASNRGLLIFSVIVGAIFNSTWKITLTRATLLTCCPSQSVFSKPSCPSPSWQWCSWY